MSSPFKRLLRFANREFSRIGLRVIKTRYFPSITERRIYRHYLGQDTFHAVLDVGTNIGQSAIAFSREFPEATIHSFEPFRGNFVQLQRAVAGFANVQCYPLGLSDRVAKLTVLRDSRHGSEWNSLEAAVQARLADDPSSIHEEVDITTGDAFCLERQIRRIDILKTDTEGHDLAVMRGFKQALEAGRITAIVSECGFTHDSGHTPFDDLHGYLRGFDYFFAGCYEPCHFESGKTEFFNALFVYRGHRLPRPPAC